MNSKAPDTKIAFYGFDAAGYDFPSEPLRLKDGSTVHFVSLNDGAKLEAFDGVVTPQGIFERIRIKEGYMGYYGEVTVAKDRLLERERQARNLIAEAKWVCFLVGDITDHLPSGNVHQEDITDTDLCKRLLNAISVPWTSRKLHESGLTGVAATSNEFIGFVRDYGVAKMSFEFPYGKPGYKTLARAGGYPVGFEHNGALFFLPFHSTKKDKASLATVAHMLVPAILDYRQKQRAEVPEWAAAFRFQSEAKLRKELDALADRAAELQAAIQVWDDFKAILTSCS